MLLAAPLSWAVACTGAEPATAADGRYVIQSWDTDDGLPHSMVNAVVKRRDGFIWIATLAGIARFDGNSFLQVPSPLIQTDKSRSVHNLIEEDPETLLLACDNTGLLRLRDGRVSVHPATAQFPAGRTVVALFNESPDVFWLAFDNREVWRWDKGAIERFPPATASVAAWPPSFAKDRGGSVFVARGGGIERYRDRRLAPIAGAPAGDVTLGSSATGGAWAITANRIYRLGDGGIAPVAGSVPWPGNIPPTVLKESGDGSLWVGLFGNGVWRWSPREAYAVTSRSMISDIQEDNDGNVWLALAGGGLERLQPAYFSVIAPEPDWIQGSASVCADAAGSIWYTNSYGIHRLDGGELVPLHLPDQWPRGALPVCADRSGRVWMALYDRIWVGRAGSSDPPELLPQAGTALVHSIFAAKDGGVWIGRADGPLELYRGAQPEILGPASGYPGTSSAQAIGEDADGHVWVGTKEGELFEYADGRFRRFGKEDGLPGGDIRAIYGDNSGTLWVGTHASGLVIRHDGRFLRVAGAQGLPDEIISQLLEDDYGALWFGTSRRLFRVYKAELLDCALGRVAAITPITYGRSDGLAGFSAFGSYEPTAWKTANGRLCFATRKGLVMTDPARLRSDQPAPRAYLDGFAVDGADAIGPGGRFLSTSRKYEFRFTAPEYIAPQDVRYRYRLDGLEADWSDPVADRSVSYPRLPPGSYRFRVTACNGNLVWNPTEAQVSFAVVPVWWETLWARLGALAAAITGLTLLVRFVSHRRLRARLARLELEQRVEADRARIARDLHDGLGASLTRVSMLAEEMCDSGGLAEIKTQSAQLAERVRTITRDLEGAVWTASPRYDTLPALCAYLSQYSLEFFANTGICCRVEVDPDIPPLPLLPHLRHHIFMIAKEAMNNAIKHSKATLMELKMGMIDGAFELVLADNGKGYDYEPAAASGRNGLRNMRARAVEFGGTLDLQSSAKGTVVRVTLPMRTGALPK
ncbi:MAG: two-component regulator propeller domain-containing protein [Opitutaceae bacterium]|jgi:signal transduction histidine kinase